ncbi:MAG: family 78 glycoside hydrolase catalytic domain [Kiritimatiellae bacterium]|nr:family 78 glycoside hydrolase catalytic domain [Kiritimatiellia bacterium]
MKKTFAVAIACTLSFTSLAAEWIAGPYEPPAESDTAAFFAPARNDVVERTFRTRDVKVLSATWRVAAPGMRDLFVNGERVSSTALPPFTPYRKRVLEETFDVTAHVRKGTENSLRVELGNGWYNLLPLKMWYVYNLREHLATGTPCVRAILEIVYEDGVRETVETDGSWCAARGRVVHNSIYLGVMEDRRLSIEFTQQARVVKGPQGKVVPAGAFPKVVVYDKWSARSVTQLSNNVWLVDMGVNATGTLRARLRGVPKGEKIRFRQGERTWPDGTVNVMTSVAGQIKDPEKGPLFAVAEQRDSVIGDGSPEFSFEPRFTFHVFRYVQVEGMCDAPRPEDFEMCAWSANVKERSHFTCSNERLNKLHEVCRRTFRANLQSVQSDCPGREKFGYGGDIAASAESFRCNWAMGAFYRKTVRDFLDEAADDGLFTETAPFVGIASKSAYPAEGQPPKSFLAVNGTRAAPTGWTLCVPVLVDLLVRYDGDMDIVREAYPALVRFVDILSARYPDDDLPECLGDWIAIEKADAKLTSLAHWHEFVAKTAKFAKLLGKSDDERRLSAHTARIAERFRRLYVKPGGVVNAGLQGEQLFALYHGLLEPKDVPAALGVLKNDIIAHGRSLTTGFFATQYLFETLSANGMADLAGDVATHKGFPGYYYMIDRGATTLWECWDEDACRNVHSNCHPMFGSVEQWLMRYVLGICVAEDAVGCDKVRIVPHAVAGITSASGWLDTPKGRISVNWHVVDGEMKVEKSIPPGIAVVWNLQMRGQ